MDKERLEEIKETHRRNKWFGGALSINQYEWLIEQAERVRELEVEVKRADDKANYFKKECSELAGVGGMWINVSNQLEKMQQENRRYRDALRLVKNNTINDNIYWEVTKALEGESE